MSSFSEAPDGDAGKGEKIFKTKCSQCEKPLCFSSCMLDRTACVSRATACRSCAREGRRTQAGAAPDLTKSAVLLAQQPS